MLLDRSGVDRQSPLQQQLAFGGEGEVGAAPVDRAGLAAQVAGALDAVDEAGETAAAHDDAVGDLEHPQPLAGRAGDGEQHVVPGELRQARSG